MDSLGCELGSTPHCLRHGGASEDFASHARSLQQIQTRGQWKSESSMQRYADTNRIGLQMQKLNPVAFELVEWLSDNESVSSRSTSTGASPRKARPPPNLS